MSEFRATDYVAHIRQACRETLMTALPDFSQRLRMADGPQDLPA